MDKTEQFIKMADCPEIQGQWKLLGGDIFAHDKYHDKKDVHYCIARLEIWGQGSSGEWYPKKLLKEGKECIWLPRQDQVQAMINYCLTNFICGLYDWFVEAGGREDEFDSYETLWLAFYMWEYHKKVWSSKEEKWVKK